MNNIYLIGMMGSGKSSTGRELARLMALSFVDLDEMIEKKVGRVIGEIFKKDGEPYFRRVESEVLNQVAAQSGQSIATGGGIVLDPSNCDLMKRTGDIIYLKTSLEVLWERVQSGRSRPLLETPNPKESLSGCLKERTPIYKELSNWSFVTDNKSPNAVALEIYQKRYKK